MGSPPVLDLGVAVPEPLPAGVPEDFLDPRPLLPAGGMWLGCFFVPPPDVLPFWALDVSAFWSEPFLGGELDFLGLQPRLRPGPPGVWFPVLAPEVNELPCKENKMSENFTSRNWDTILGFVCKLKLGTIDYACRFRGLFDPLARYYFTT